VWDRFLHLACHGASRPSVPRQLRHWLWYIVCTCTKLSLLSCNKIRAGGVASLREGLQVVYIIYVLIELIQGFFKENVRNPVWICRDPISLILRTRFSLILGTRWYFFLILGTRFEILGTRIGSLKRLKKTLVNSWLERRECFHINRYITVVNLFSISQWLQHYSADFWLHYIYVGY